MSPPIHTTHRARSHLLLCALALVALACGGGGTVNKVITPTPNPADLVRLNDAETTTVNGLNIELIGASNGVGTSGTLAYPTLGITCSPFLVLNPPPTNSVAPFSHSDIVAIQTYMDTVPVSESGSLIPATTAPPVLRWVAAGFDRTCYGELLIRNDSGKAVQITQVGLRLAAAPVVNRYQYALVDVCTTSLNPQRFGPDGADCPGASGIGGSCGNQAQVMLEAGNPGDVFSGQISNIDPTLCPAPLIQPGDTQAIGISVVNSTSRALIFQVVPLLTISDPSTGATTTLTLSALPTTLAFSTASQYECYGLSNGSLVREPYNGSVGHFCV